MQCFRSGRGVAGQFEICQQEGEYQHLSQYRRERWEGDVQTPIDASCFDELGHYPLFVAQLGNSLHVSFLTAVVDVDS